MGFDLGDTWALGSVTRDDAGTLANATTVVLTITLPDGTTTSPTVTNPPVAIGTYVYDYVPLVEGRFTARWVFTFTGGKTAAFTDTVYVEAATPLGIVSLAEAKLHLNLAGTADDEEVRGWVEAMTELVEGDPEFGVGPVVVRTYTEEVPRGPSWWMQRYPVVSITSVAALFTSSPLVGQDVTLVSETGRVRRADGMPFTDGPWVVTYKAGRTVIPGNIRKASLIILKHMWETQRGGPKRPTRGGDDAAPTGSSYVMPNRARELLAPHRRGPRQG